MSQITLSANAAGTAIFTVAAPGTNTNRTITLPDATTTLVGTDATQTLTNKTIQGGALTLATAKAFNWNGVSTNTFLDFESVPSWVKRVTVMLDGISTSGTSGLMLQIGDSGGIETTGYASYVFTPTTLALQPSNGFALSHSSAAAILWSGIATVCNISGNTWCQGGNLGSSSGGWGGFSGGGKALSATLDRVRITTVNGTDTFDAGTVNIMYEG